MVKTMRHKFVTPGSAKEIGNTMRLRQPCSHKRRLHKCVAQTLLKRPRSECISNKTYDLMTAMHTHEAPVAQGNRLLKSRTLLLITHLKGSSQHIKHLNQCGVPCALGVDAHSHNGWWRLFPPMANLPPRLVVKSCHSTTTTSSIQHHVRQSPSRLRLSRTGALDETVVDELQTLPLWRQCATDDEDESKQWQCSGYGQEALETGGQFDMLVLCHDGCGRWVGERGIDEQLCSPRGDILVGLWPLTWVAVRPRIHGQWRESGVGVVTRKCACMCAWVRVCAAIGQTRFLSLEWQNVS